jgi:hypothetical protein
MDIAALLLACSVHADDALQLSIASVFSRGEPYVVLDVRWRSDAPEEAGAVVPSTPAATRSAVERITAAGGEPVLGLLPIRPSWALEFGKTLDEALQPCSSVAIGSARLSEFDYACRSRGPTRSGARRNCTLDRYGKSLSLPGLRRAVLSDLTLPSPFPDPHGEQYETTVNASTSPPSAGSGLFFAPLPVAPPLRLSDESAITREQPR